VWQNPEFQSLVIGALNWASRRIDVDVIPNIEQATPEANVKVSAAPNARQNQAPKARSEQPPK
jgi:hypothetical protein